MLANVDKGLVVVDHRQKLTDNKISKAITSIGYPTKAASKSEYNIKKSLSSESPGWRSPSNGFLSWILGIFSR